MTMTETPEEFAERLQKTVLDAADMHLSVVQVQMGVNTDEMFAADEGHREMFQSGVMAGYTATMTVLQQWGLLSGGENPGPGTELMKAQGAKVRAAWDEGHQQGVQDATSVPRTGMTYRVTPNPYRKDGDFG